MPKGIKISPTLNHDRLEVIRKGHVNIPDLMRFIPASRNKAEHEYEILCREAQLRDGKQVGWWGVDIKRVLEHYNMTEQDVRRWAKDEIVSNV